MQWRKKAEKWKIAQREVWARDGYRCQYCMRDCRDNPTVDHLVPRALGGDDRRANLITSCWECNNKKADSDPIEFVAKLKPNSGKKHKRKENQADKAIREAAERRKRAARWQL